MSEKPLLGERDNYADYLDSRREAFEKKCEGLTPEQLALRSVPPSSMSLLGLLRHLAEVERGWWRRALAGESPERLWGPRGADADFNDVVGEQSAVDEAWAAWRVEVAYGQEWLAAHDDMGAVVDGHHHGQLNVRDVVVHLIEEYAQHLGHADLLRECIDGRTGQ
ncbi:MULTISPECIES: DinB family protein [unclassified Knoellia]|uniref:DinB family protein n=1 Tax=Knoellia altitudinis TaxID=3404795 RepID=UPI00361813AC